MVDTPLFKKACIIGIGLIGTSLARGCAQKNLVTQIVGYDSNDDHRKEAVSLGAVRAAPDTLQEAVQGCDLVIVSVPVGAIPSVFRALNKYADSDAIVMDVGSVKACVVDHAGMLREDLRFVPSHPVSGTEQSGPASGFAALFENRWSIITPLTREDTAYAEAVALIEALWRGLGAEIVRMSAKHHDRALAITSHLPHLIAFTLVGAADDMEGVHEAEIVKYAAGGFRDFTRIASSDPVMWRDVFLNNKEAVLEVLGRFSEELAVMQRAIRWSDGQTLEQAFTRARRVRHDIVAAGQESDTPNFGRKS